MLNSSAWARLSTAERAVYIEIARVYDGKNNGQLGLSARMAAKRCRISKDTASRAFKTLEKGRFIEIRTRGAFSRKCRHATEYRLMEHRCDVTGDLPQRDFLKS
jgi:hypothetical protein